MFFRKSYRFREKECVLPQSNNRLNGLTCTSVRTSLCTLKKGSITVEAALVIPFFLTILLAFYQFFLLYSSAAELKVQAAADAKKLGIAANAMQPDDSGEIVIYKTKQLKDGWSFPFFMQKTVTQRAVCRGWIGFTGLETEEMGVYMTQEGSVYHLYSDCTHLKLSIQSISLEKAKVSKNQYGTVYRQCLICDKGTGMLAYITSEGDCYHSDRNCSGLKRTVRQVPISEANGVGCCLRCAARGGT